MKKTVWICLLLIMAIVPVLTIPAAAADYTNGVDVSGTTATIWFKSTVNTTWADVHYKVNSGAQQDFRMTFNSAAARYEQKLSAATGNVISYSFTYNNGTPAYNTPTFTYTVGSTGGGGTPTAVATPTFSPASGTYSSAQNVTISTATAGATIRYTTDGTTPTAASAQYTGAIAVASSKTIKAIGMKSGLTDSAVSSATYTISAASADYTQNAAAVNSTTAKISFKSNVNSTWADVHYTVAGGAQQSMRMTNAGAGNWEYSITGLVSGNVINYYFTYEKAGIAIDSAKSSYTFTPGGGGGTPTTAATPAFSPAGGTYTSAQSVTIATATAGATIRYTTDGSTPSAASPQYTGPISVTSTKTIKAIAIKSGLTNSAVATAAYTISTTPPPPSTDGTFPAIFVNNTRSVYANSQIYIYFLFMNPAGQWCYLKPDGTVVPVNPADANAPNHLTKNGVNYANYSFSLAQASTVKVPTYVRGGRVYISYGSPMYIPIGNNAWGGPDLLNPVDPNNDVIYDWYEFTYVYKEVPFGGNTTQVDMFGIPMTVRLQQNAIGYDQTVGITLTRDQVFSQYAAGVNAAFKPLANNYRIVAPRSSSVFKPGGAQANYMQAYIDQTWNLYTTNPFTLTRLNQTFTGKVVNARLQFTKDGIGPFFLSKPTTTDVMACAGALASAGMNTTELELGAEFCAAFNRGVAMNTANWYNPAAYYTNAVKNDFSGFFHTIGIDKRAYGFAYDDVNDQSSVKILPNSNPPTSLTFNLGW